MNEVLLLALALSAGVLLGAVFFGGLWWTVRKGVSSEQPALVVLRRPAAADEHCPGRILLCFRRSLGAIAALSHRICHGAPDGDVADPVARR